jgi:hypothetical protein
MLPGLVLTAVFIWFAENLGTFAGAWIYPSQHHGWRLAPFEKVGSWYLLMLLSFVLVTLVHPVRPVSWAEQRAGVRGPLLRGRGVGCSAAAESPRLEQQQQNGPDGAEADDVAGELQGLRSLEVQA